MPLGWTPAGRPKGFIKPNDLSIGCLMMMLGFVVLNPTYGNHVETEISEQVFDG
jgi:hypothetical protein